MNKIKVKSKDELAQLIEQEIEQQGLNANLNHLDIFGLTDLSYVFSNYRKFNGDISQWDVSNVVNMSGMFYESGFNGDISRWDVSNVEDMGGLFYNSKFNGDISQWNTSNVTNMNGMFSISYFNQDISNWDVSKVNGMCYMFSHSQFNHNLDGWKTINLNDSIDIFVECVCELPYWANCRTNEEIRTKIDIYQIYQEQIKLDNALSDDINGSKKLKI